MIGVNDNGKIIGIEVDKYKNYDQFLLSLNQDITNQLSPNPINIPDLISITRKKIDFKTICRINVKASNMPIYSNFDGKEKFYKRLF